MKRDFSELGARMKLAWRIVRGRDGNLVEAARLVRSGETVESDPYGHTAAWFAVWDALKAVRPGFFLGPGTGKSLAVQTIKDLAKECDEARRRADAGLGLLERPDRAAP